MVLALSVIPSSTHIEGILKNILGGQCKPFRDATLRQICGIGYSKKWVAESALRENGSYTTLYRY